MKAVVKLRGSANIQGDVEDTLSMLNVHARNHCTLVPETPAYEGMLTKVNDYVAFGEPSSSVLATVLRRRAEPLAGDAAVDDAWIDANTEYADAEALAEALLDESTTLEDVGLSPSLRLHPPRGGHDGVKRAVSEGGTLGQHDTETIDALLEAMR